MSDQQTDWTFCQDQLRKYDPLYHFIALTSPQEHRSALIALYAFVNEIERIPLQVSDPSMGEIRLQWWLDIVQQSKGQGDQKEAIGPLATCLKQVQADYSLSLDHLAQIIEARKFDLYHDPMPDWPTFETYAGETKALPQLLAAQILNDGVLPDVADLCGHSAMALCLTQNLIHFSRHAKGQKLYLPMQNFTDKAISQSQIWAQQQGEDFLGVLQGFADQAKKHADLAQKYQLDLKQKGQTHMSSAFLERALVPALLKRWHKKPWATEPLPLWRQYWAIWHQTLKG
ncbi:MAG: squalene/phytoene synthase family protein [Cohaesibacter sp.]|nr:squalene/phytoene synthase family protein [Cohaesibacter sp.]